MTTIQIFNKMENILTLHELEKMIANVSYVKQTREQMKLFASNFRRNVAEIWFGNNNVVETIFLYRETYNPYQKNTKELNLTKTTKAEAMDMLKKHLSL